MENIADNYGNDEPKIEYTDLKNKSYPIEKFLFSQEDTLEEIKERFKIGDDVIAQAVKYDMDKTEKNLEDLKAMICGEQSQLARDAEFLTNAEVVGEKA
jgi:hypothetical protein